MAYFASVSSDPNSPVYSPVAGDEIFHDAPTHQMPPPPTTAKRGIRTAAGTSIPWARIHEVHTSQLRGHLRFLKMIAESKGYTAKVSECTLPTLPPCSPPLQHILTITDSHRSYRDINLRRGSLKADDRRSPLLPPHNYHQNCSREAPSLGRCRSAV